MGPNPMTFVLIRRPREDTDMQGGGLVTTETEVGGMRLQAEERRDCWRPRKPQHRKAYRGQSSLLVPSRGARPCRHLDFGLLASRAVSE